MSSSSGGVGVGSGSSGGSSGLWWYSRSDAFGESGQNTQGV